MNIIYLHGFASGPQSRKARFFAERFAGLGIQLATPDLTPSGSEGGFEALTLSYQLERIHSIVSGMDPASVVVMGSSMGGYLAALYAARQPRRVSKIICLAPAFRLARLWREAWEGKIPAWRQTGSLEVFHYASGAPARIGYGLLADADSYEDYPAALQPALVFHGTADPIVPIEVSREFARLRGARLVEYPSGHELTDCLEPMWAETAAFLGLPNARRVG